MTRPSAGERPAGNVFARLLVRMDFGGLAFNLGVSALLFGTAVLINPLTFLYGLAWDALADVAGPLAWGGGSVALGLALLFVPRGRWRERLLLASVAFWAVLSYSTYITSYGLPPITIAPMLANAIGSFSAYCRAVYWRAPPWRT